MVSRGSSDHNPNEKFIAVQFANAESAKLKTYGIHTEPHTLILYTVKKKKKKEKKNLQLFY